jgi:hypothetical protein
MPRNVHAQLALLLLAMAVIIAVGACVDHLSPVRYAPSNLSYQESSK